MQVQTHVLIKKNGLKKAEANVREILDSYFLILILKSIKNPQTRYSPYFKNYNNLLNSCSCTVVEDKMILKFNLKKSKLLKNKTPQNLKNIFKEIKQTYKTEHTSLNKIKIVSELILNTQQKSI